MGNMFSTRNLKVNDEGFIDFRRNPPATRVQVQGGIEAIEPAATVDVVAEPPAAPREEVLPAIQKTTEGLQQSVAGPVKIRRNAEIPHRLESKSGEKCYAIVSKSQFNRLQHWHWIGAKTGHMFRRIKHVSGQQDTIVWLHREASQCNRADKFVAFLDGDERNLLKSNTRIVDSKEEARAIRHAALQRSAHGR